MNTPRWMRLAVTVAATTLIVLACSKKESREEETSESAAPVEASAPSVVVAMIDAHGGMAGWRSAKTVSFESEFIGPGDTVAIVTRVMVDQQKRRAYIDYVGTNESLAWDGKRAWSMNWTQPYPPRFAALLDYYFLSLPWLTMDPGVRLTVEEKDTLWETPTQYEIVKMTFARGVGDTPGDSYRLYIDPVSKRLKGFSYIATYRSLLPDSIDAMPQHIVLNEDFSTVDGLVVPTRYTIYRMDQSVIGSCVIREWSFDRAFDEARMKMPEGAVVDESKPQ